MTAHKVPTTSQGRLVGLDLTGPGTPMYKVFSDLSVVYAMYPAFLFVVTSEAGGKGVDDHDRVAKLSSRDSVRAEDMLGRLNDTLDLVAGIVFAGRERPLVAHAIRELHRHIEGHLASGERYHAWERDLWSWTWAGILQPIMHAHELLRGWESDQFRQDTYTGLLQIGALFNAQGLPERHDDFLVYWKEKWLPYMDTSTTDAANFIAQQSMDPIGFRVAPWLPRPVFLALSWPIRRVLRTSFFMLASSEIFQAVGVFPTQADQRSVRRHLAVWRRIPLFLTSRVVPAYFWLRLKFGNPSWRTHYSPESLAQYRGDMKVAKELGTPEPPRPSARH